MAVLDDFFTWFFRAHPVSATFIGVHEHDHRLPDWSEHGRGDALASINDLAARLERSGPDPKTEGERLDRALAASSLEVLRWEAAAPQFAAGNPSAYAGEAVFGVIALLLRPFAPLRVRVEAAVERMLAVPAFLAQARAHVRRAPRPWIERALRECEGALALFERGVEIFARDEGLEHPGWRQAAGAAAGAFREYHAHLSAELPEAPEGGYACGGEALERLIRRGHWLEMDAAEVLALGREHLASAGARLEAEARGAGVGDWREGLRRLSDHHPDAARYYARFAEVWQEARAAAEAHGLVTWPDYPIRYAGQPRWAREAAPSLYFLFYRAPAAFDRLPVVDYLVPPVEPEMPAEEQGRRLRATNDSVIKLNHVVHHGGLGHHVQNWYAYHRAASRIGRIAAVDCASRIALFCGGTMAEGWACYATDLMEAIGCLTPLERLAQAHTRLRMASRAVADVQLHTGAWTIEETAAFYQDAAAMPAEAARAEAVKNSMFPGAALMYLTGNEAIHRLRGELRGRKGFTLRTFHDRLLSYGSVPAPLVASEMLAAG
ncbi:MAG TPA: DUF885 family protein [bacterium]|nr:DUF885 family protein [bacterium]